MKFIQIHFPDKESAMFFLPLSSLKSIDYINDRYVEIKINDCHFSGLCKFCPHSFRVFLNQKDDAVFSFTIHDIKD